jgi:hypothetical protein
MRGTRSSTSKQSAGKGAKKGSAKGAEQGAGKRPSDEDNNGAPTKKLKKKEKEVLITIEILVSHGARYESESKMHYLNPSRRDQADTQHGTPIRLKVPLNQDNRVTWNDIKKDVLKAFQTQLRYPVDFDENRHLLMQASGDDVQLKRGGSTTKYATYHPLHLFKSEDWQMETNGRLSLTIVSKVKNKTT